MELLTKSSESYRLTPSGLTKVIWAFVFVYFTGSYILSCSGITTLQFGSVRFPFGNHIFISVNLPFSLLFKNSHLQIPELILKMTPKCWLRFYLDSSNLKFYFCQVVHFVMRHFGVHHLGFGSSVISGWD